MWWPSRSSVVILDAGFVATSLPRYEVRECDVGEELSTLRELLQPASGIVDVLLGPAFVRLAALDRINGVWRQQERVVAAATLLQLPDDQMHTLVIDPAPRSRWLTVTIQRLLTAAIRESVAVSGVRLRRLEPLMFVLPRPISTGAPVWLLLDGKRHSSWLVLDGRTLVGAGTTEKSEATLLERHIAKDALRLGVATPLIRRYEIKDNIGSKFLDRTIRRVVRPLDAAL